MSGAHAVRQGGRGTQARLAELALVGIAAVWGLTFVMVQDAIAILPTMAFLGYRFAPAAVIVAVVFRRRLTGLGHDGLRAGLAMGGFLTAGYVLQTLGLEATSASNAGFITGLFVVLTPVLGAVFLRDRIPAVAWVAAGVSALGLYLLSGTGAELNLRGDGLVLGCAVAFAAHILATARAVRRHDAGALLVVQLAVAGVLCLAGAAALGDLEVPRGATVWSALVVCAVVASALGFFVQTYAQRHASPARTALILASEPVFAGLFAYWLAGERLGAPAWAGAGLIMAAILAIEVVPRLRPPRPLPEG
jgi:drug/metabolite transporter (DMT)-like permease